MNIKEYLKSLGNTADDVADSLRKQGVKGLKVSTCMCPVINGIYQACPDYWSGLRITGGVYSNGKCSYAASLNDTQIMDPQLPQPVQDFIGGFDEGAYPDLEARLVKKVTTTVWE